MAISLPLSKANLSQLLKEIIANTSPYTHQDFANWCSDHFTNIIVNDLDITSTGIDEKTFEVLNDVDAQWDLFLANTYKPEELNSMDFAKVELPKEWFMNWLKQIQVN